MMMNKIKELNLNITFDEIDLYMLLEMLEEFKSICTSDYELELADKLKNLIKVKLQTEAYIVRELVKDE